MKDERKTKKELLEELRELRRRVGDLESAAHGGVGPEEEVQIRLADLQMYVENLIDGFGVADEKGRIIEANTSLARMMGYRSPKELIGMSLFGLSAKRELPRIRKMFMEAVRKRTPVIKDLQTTMRRGDGSEFPAVLNASNLWTKEGRFLGNIAVIRDVSEVKRMEAERRQMLHELCERTRELDCLYSISRTAQKATASLGEILHEVVTVIPPAWQYPEIACARIEFGSQEFKTPNYRATRWKQVEVIRVQGEKVGCVEVRYMEPRANIDEGPFLKEERNLIGAIADLLGSLIEYRLGEEQLKASEERLKILFEYAPDAYYLNTLRGNFVDGNIAAEQLTGYRKEELIGKNFLKSNLLPRKEIPRAAKLLAENALGLSTGPDEFTLIRKDGDPVRVEIRTFPVKIRGQSLTLGIARDVTAKRELEARFSAIHDFSRQISGVLDLEEILNLTLDIVERTLGHRYCAILLIDPLTKQLYVQVHRGYSGKHVKDFRLPIDSVKGISAWVARKRRPVVVPDVQKDPRYIPGMIGAKSEMAAPLNVGNEVLGVIDVSSPRLNAFSESDLGMLSVLASYVAISVKNSLLFRDIEAERKKLQDIIDEVGDVIGITGMHGEIVQINRAVESWGFNRKELIGKPVAKFLAKHSLPELEEERKKTLKTGVVRNIELTGCKKDGSEFPVLVSVTLIRDLRGKLAGRVFSLRDITELKESRDLLEQQVEERTRELREAQEKLLRSERLATIGQFASSVGHELRNPLAVMANTLYLLSLKLKDPGDTVRRHLTRIEKELRRSDKVISELLEFSRDRKPSFEPTRVNRLIEEVLSKFAVPAGVEVVTQLQELPDVMADSTQLQSVLINLISNGIEAMATGGILTVRTTEQNGNVRVAVSDTGEGISRENVERVFEPLFTTKATGIGLGLCVTKKFVENHGGSIEIESKAGGGTTFTVTLPISGRQER